jgi:hypothetical protein
LLTADQDRDDLPSPPLSIIFRAEWRNLQDTADAPQLYFSPEAWHSIRPRYRFQRKTP